MPASKREQALAKVPINEVWGIGRRSIKKLTQEGIQTALDYSRKSEAWIRRFFNVTGVRTWKELNGIPAITLASRERQKSIMYSRTFAHMTDSKTILLKELSNYATAATRRLREQGSLCGAVTVFLATNRHRTDLAQYQADDTIKLTTATDDTRLIIEAVQVLLERVFQPRFQYKQAGVILSQLESNAGVQLDLFAPRAADETFRQKRLMKAIDTINERFGKNQIHFAVQGSDEDTEDEPAGFLRPHNVE